MVNEQTKQKIINESQKERKYVLLQVNLKDRGRKKKRLQMTEKSEREKWWNEKRERTRENERELCHVIEKDVRKCPF